MRVRSKPYNGGLNSDDSLENMPINDYESLKNMKYKKGVNFLEKLNGTVALPVSISGDCFGWFKFPDYTVLFIDDTGTHSIHLLYPDDSVVKVMDLTKFELDTTIDLVSCVLVNDIILVFNNGIDEVHKLHIDMGKLWVEFSGPNTNFKDITLTTNSGKIVFNCVAGFSAGITRVLTVGEKDASILTRGFSLLFHNPLLGQVIRGFLFDSNTFITELDAIGDVSTLIGVALQISETSITSIDYPYRGYYQSLENDVNLTEETKVKDHFLINGPSLDPPETQYVDEANSSQNNLKNNTFQFQVKYIFVDGTQSSWSPISKLILDDFVGNLTYERNNKIVASTPHPLYYGCYDVKEVVFGVRKNEGKLYEFDRKEITSVIYITTLTNVPTIVEATYTGREILINVEEREASNTFDHIGKASGLELVSQSSILLSNNKIASSRINVGARIDPFEESPGTLAVNSYVYAYAYNPYSYSIIFKSGYQHRLDGQSLDILWTSASNEDGKGKGIDPDNLGGQALIDIYTATSKMSRGKEAGFDKSYSFFTFSSSQDVGAEYEVSISLWVKDPRSGNLSLIKNASEDFVCVSTSTHAIMDTIIAWVNAVHTDPNGAGMHNLPYGVDGDFLEVQALRGTFNGPFNPDDASFSMQVFGGYQCIHNDPGHYHWHQIDEISVTIIKKSSPFYNRKSCKNQAKHPLAFRYRDTFGRVLQTTYIGDLDLSDRYRQDRINYPEIAITSFAPEKAVRYDVLYPGNKSIEEVAYSVIENFINNGNTDSEFDLRIEEFNGKNGGNLNYSFVEGDYVRRAYSGASVLAPQENKPLRILSQDATGKLTVEFNVAGNLANDDMIVIYRPKKDIEDKDLLYHEVGYSFPILDGFHKGNIRDQEIGGQEVIAAFQITKAYLRESSLGLLQLFVTLDSGTPYPKATMPTATTVTILNGALLGTYQANTVTIGPNPPGFPNGANGWDLTVNYNQALVDDYGAIDDIYITWDTATAADEDISTSIYNNQAIIRLPDLGDAYIRWRGAPYDYFVESYAMSDFYDSERWGRGRPATIGEELDLDFGGIIWHSQPYFNNTTLNGLSTVYSDAYEEYSSTKGAILAMVQFGDTVILFKEREISRVKINKDEFEIGSGNTLSTVSGAVISPTEKEFIYTGGISDQVYSIVKSKNAVYFVDRNNKTVNRIAQNGITQISDYKMSSEFISLLKEDGMQVYSIFDRDLDMLILHFKSGSTNKQLTFKEGGPQPAPGDNRWKAEWEINHDRVMYHQRLMSYKAGIGFLMHTDENNRLLVGGVGLLAQMIKTFSADNKLCWTNMALDPLFINRNAVMSNDEGQASLLFPTDFEEIGAAFWAGFRLDSNTPNVSDPLYNGDELQSRLLTIQLESDSIANDKLGNIDVEVDEVE